MAAFTNFNNRLPDPTFTVNSAGTVEASGTAGPGFASVTVTSQRPVQVSRTVSGRGIHRETGSHTWEINVSYHPMRRDEFDVVQSFLDARNGRMKPFFVVLPQNSKPKDPVFATYAATNVLSAAVGHQAGTPYVLMQGSAVITGSAKPGDFFTISDANDVNHLKAYKVTRVETNDTYQSGSTRPTTSQIRVHTLPPLAKFVSSGSVINWINPAFRVIQKSDTMEYQLSTDNLYQFGLNLEEIQP